jgi:tripartite-type tricarboxylate transporter receptor subunit TctC
MRAVGFGPAIAMMFLTGFLAGAASPRLALAQNDYPTRPVGLIVPYAAGGVADVAMRMLGDKLSTRLGQQFVIENRPGAGGIVAAQAATSAPGDGYTLLMTGNNTAIAAALFKSLPYNVLTDFASISTAAFFDLLVVTRAGSPLHSVNDVIAAPSIPAARKTSPPNCSPAPPRSKPPLCRSAPRPIWPARFCAATLTWRLNSTPR